MNRDAFENLVESLADAVFVLSLPERQISYSNAAAQRMFGWSARELIGASTRILHVDDAHFDRFHGATHPVVGGGQSFQGEFQMRRRDGEVFPTRHSVSRFEDGAGKRFAVSVIRDLSEERQRDQLIRQDEARFRVIEQHLRKVFWITNADKSRMDYVSPGYEDLWGRSIEDLYRRPMAFFEAIVPEDRARIQTLLQHQVDGSYDVEYQIQRPDGSRRWIWDRAVPVLDEQGEVTLIVGIAEDITAIKQREAELVQAKKMEAVGRLTGGIAHDFNNLLTVIAGNAELLLEAYGDDELIQEILYASRRAAELTGQLMSFSRQRPFRRERVDVNALIKELTALLRRVIGADVVLELDLADELWVIATDRAQLEASLVNLAINARDAMPSGGRLTLHTHNETCSGPEGDASGQLAGGDYVVIRVQDTGVGMAPEVLEKVFEPFFTTKAVGKGTGLGLATVFGFARVSGGQVEVSSALGQGSTFTLFLPRASDEGELGEGSGERPGL